MGSSVFSSENAGRDQGLQDHLARTAPDSAAMSGIQLGPALPCLGCLSFLIWKMKKGSRPTCPEQGCDQRMGWNEE